MGNIVEPLSSAQADARDVTAIIDRDIRLTYGQLYDRARRLAAGLLHRYPDLRGARCGLAARTSYQSVELYYALSLLGAVFVPLDPSLPAEELAARISRTNVRLLFVSKAYIPQLRQLYLKKQIPSVQVLISLDGEYSRCLYYNDLFCSDSSSFPEPDPGGAAMNAILFSSGRTGRARAVAFSHDTFLCEVAKTRKFRERVTALVCLPIFHISGLIAILGSARNQNTLVLSSWTTPQNWYQTVQRHQVNLCVLSPSLLLELTEQQEREPQPVPSLNGIRFGWDMTPPLTIRRAVSAFPQIRFSQIYGLTETVGNMLESSVACTGRTDPASDRRFRSIGRAENDSIQIVDEAGQALEPGQVGEVLVRPHSQILGWIEESGAFLPKTEAWIHTRDMGYFDEDSFLYLIGFKPPQDGSSSLSPTTIYPDIYSSRQTDGCRGLDSMQGVVPTADAELALSLRKIIGFHLSLQECTTLQELEQAYLSQIKTIVDANLYGLCLLEHDAETLHIEPDQGSAFDLKWIQPSKWNLSLHTMEHWPSGQGELIDAGTVPIQEINAHFSHYHTIYTPLFSDRQHLIGILYFARPETALPFRRQDESLIRIVASVVCGTLIHIYRIHALTQKNDTMQRIIRTIGNAVLVSNLQGDVQYINENALELLNREQKTDSRAGLLERIQGQLKWMKEKSLPFYRATLNYFSQDNPNPQPLALKSIAGEGDQVITMITALNRNLEFNCFRGMLSPRAIELLNLLMLGKSNEEIASALMVTRYTVNYHLQQIYRKLGVSNKSDLIVKAFAIMSGAVSGEECPGKHPSSDP